ncbi:MAG TPA: hypothetical protein PKE00_17680, partial [Planctomycetota bacterium]|nr:hypothetical protein [Planctomycetota bacterium]
MPEFLLHVDVDAFERHAEFVDDAAPQHSAFALEDEPHRIVAKLLQWMRPRADASAVGGSDVLIFSQVERFETAVGRRPRDATHEVACDAIAVPLPDEHVDAWERSKRFV